LVNLNSSVRALNPSDKKYLCANSSGSTGHRVEVLFDSLHQRGRFAARARYLHANGWNPLLRSAWIIGIRPGSPDGSLVNGGFIPRATFASHTEDFGKQVDWLTKVDPHFLYVFPSTLEAFLAVIADQKRRLPSLRRVFTGGEVLEDSVRSQTRGILGVEIADNYGTTEAFVGWQCLVGSYHVNSEHALVEIVDEHGRPVSSGKAGRVVITTLENRLMPLIRYDLGDYAILIDELCACGRTLPRIGNILGRTINLFRLPNGQLFSPWRLVGLIKAGADVRQVQIIQQALDRYLVRFVGASTLELDGERSIRDGFRKIVGGDISVSFERVTDIPRTAGGKFMAALSAIQTHSS
jgi:phenylacetate-CoA ligase